MSVDEIRWLIRRDMKEVLDIDFHSFDHFWEEERYLSHLRQRNKIGMVATRRGDVCGFMIYELGASHLTLLRFAVDPNYRRLGIGSTLLDKLTGKLSKERRTRLEIVVRESNLPGLLFLRDYGFQAVELTREWFEDSGEDAITMVYSILDDQHLNLKYRPTNRISNYNE